MPLLYVKTVLLYWHQVLMKQGPLTLFRPGWGGGGLLRPASTLELCNFLTVYGITTKFCDW